MTVKLQMRDTRRFVETRLQDLSGLWEGEPRIAREEIANTCKKSRSNRCCAAMLPRGLGIGSEYQDLRLLWWCRGPESNWLRPPFQGGALPLSYPGTEQILETRSVRVKLSIKINYSVAS